jgi:hypothetical protein
MIRACRMFGVALVFSGAASYAKDGDSTRNLVAAAAPLEIPHTTALAFQAKPRRKSAAADFETPRLLNPTPGLEPLQFPKNTDLRARLLTPELRRTPLVGWVAANLYRDRKDNGWCLELDPGDGEYVVFYRMHLK